MYKRPVDLYIQSSIKTQKKIGKQLEREAECIQRLVQEQKLRDIILILTNIFFTFCNKNLIDYTKILVILETF